VSEYWESAKIALIEHGWRVVLIIIMMFAAIKIAKWLCDRFFHLQAKGKDEEFQKRADTLSSVTSSFVGIVVSVLAGVMILAELGIPIAPIITAAGVVGIAAGFGGQYIIRDVITGFFILYDNQIRVGDVVDIAGKGGLVEKVGLRLTTLRDLSGNVHYVRNGEIHVVTNMTMDYSRYVFDIGVAYRENVDEVIEIVKEIDRKLRDDPMFSEDILEPIEILGLDKFGDSAVIIKARTKTKPIKQWSVAREFNRRLKITFDERDIEIPFPHATLYMGRDKVGGAAPLHLAIEKESA